NRAPRESRRTRGTALRCWSLRAPTSTRCAPVPARRSPRRVADESSARRSRSSAGDRRDDRDLLAALELRAQPVEEADVLFTDVDVDELAHALFVEQPVLDAWVLFLELLDGVADGARRFERDLFVAAGERAERGGDADGHGHDVCS